MGEPPTWISSNTIWKNNVYHAGICQGSRSHLRRYGGNWQMLSDDHPRGRCHGHYRGHAMLSVVMIMMVVMALVR